ncbi:hypothetical protein [Thermocrinis sp.]
MTLFWRCIIGWSPAVLLFVWIYGRWQIPSLTWLWIPIPFIAFGVGVFALVFKMRQQKIRRHEMAGAFARAFASLVATEASLSIPLLLTAIVLIGALGNLVESGDVPLLLNILAWLIFTACMTLLLEPPSSTISTSQIGLPPLTKGLILFLSRKPPSPEGQERWQRLEKETQRLNSNSTPTLDELKNLPELIRQRRGMRRNAPPPENWVEALADTPLAPPFYAIAYHSQRLEHLWIVVTEQTKGDELSLFCEICQRLKFQFQLHELELKNPDDLPSIQQVINTAYREAKSLGLPESEVTTDITSGSSLMSVGGVLACVRSQRRVQYLNQTTYELQEVPVSVENVAEAIQEFLEQLSQLMRKAPQEGRQ